jgi:ferredoxin-NADP reductase
VTSLVLEPTDGRPLAAALPGQFIALRLKPAPDAPALLRSYSLSDKPRDDRYRVSIKRELHGAAGRVSTLTSGLATPWRPARHAAASR